MAGKVTQASCTSFGLSVIARISAALRTEIKDCKI